MQASVSEISVNHSPRRKNKSSSAEAGVVQLEALRESLKELEVRHERMVGAREDYASVVKVVSERSQVKPAVIRALIAARLSERGERAVERAQQMALVFDSIGL